MACPILKGETRGASWWAQCVPLFRPFAATSLTASSSDGLEPNQGAASSSTTRQADGVFSCPAVCGVPSSVARIAVFSGQYICTWSTPLHPLPVGPPTYAATAKRKKGFAENSCKKRMRVRIFHSFVLPLVETKVNSSRRNCYGSVFPEPRTLSTRLLLIFSRHVHHAPGAKVTRSELSLYPRSRAPPTRPRGYSTPHGTIRQASVGRPRPAQCRHALHWMLVA